MIRLIPRDGQGCPSVFESGREPAPLQYRYGISARHYHTQLNALVGTPGIGRRTFVLHWRQFQSFSVKEFCGRWVEEIMAPTSTSWPSGLRRNVKAVVFVGVGSNPTDVTLLRKLPLLLKVVRTLSIVAGSNSTRVIFWYQQRQLLYYDFPAGARSLSFSYIIGPYCASSKTKTKSSSEGRIIESSLGRKLNLAFRRNYDRSGDYCRQSTVG